MQLELHVGIDDADSPWGMCTTFLGALLVVELVKRGCAFMDFPYLVRLNPNVPFKTRGNGAVSLHLKFEGEADEIERLVGEYLFSYAHAHGKSDPTAVLLVGSPHALRAVYRRALSELVPPSVVLKTLGKLRAHIIGNVKSRGIVGAAASVGAFGVSAYSYELLLYRDSSQMRDRSIENEIVELDRLLRPLLHSNVDYSAERVLASPHGPDPVIAGIRSFNPMILSSIAPRLAKRWGARLALIYKTNQATGIHLAARKTVILARPYDALTIRGRVSGAPRTLPGGHVQFTLDDGTGRVACMVYRETGFLTRVARLLRDGDTVEVGGGLVPRLRGLTLNVECIRVIVAGPNVITENPPCPVCGKRLKSAGRGKGFKCAACGHRTRSMTRVTKVIPRTLEPGLYLQSPRAYRHLSRTRETMGARPVSVPPLPQLFLWPYPPP